jgi:malate dehydrogenase
MRKIGIVGSGRVGESAAHDIAMADLCREIVLVDIKDGLPQGAALDIQQAAPLCGSDTRLHGANQLDALSGCELVIVTAGVQRAPGMTRTDVLDINLPIVLGVVDAIARYAPGAILIVVTNPVDVLTHAAWKRMGMDRARVLGLSGVLDAARMASFIAEESGLSARDVSAMVLGGHGDAMAPLPRFSSIGCVPLDALLTPGQIETIVARVRDAGAEILSLRKTSSAYGAPGAALCCMVDAIAHDRKRILPCVAALQGEYGEHNLCLGVPVVLGARGVERVIELPLNEAEAADFRRSAESVRADIARLKSI